MSNPWDEADETELAGAESGDESGAQARPAPSASVNEPGVVEAFAERGGAAVPPSATPGQLLGPEDPELPPDVLEAAGRRLANEPLPGGVGDPDRPSESGGGLGENPSLEPRPEQVVIKGWTTVHKDQLEHAYRWGYDLRECPAEWLRSPCCVAWADGVRARHAELMPERAKPDLKAALQLELKKRSSWD